MTDTATSAGTLTDTTQETPGGEGIAATVTPASAKDDLTAILASYRPISASRIKRVLSETDAAALMQAGAFGSITDCQSSAIRDELSHLANAPEEIDKLSPTHAVQLTRLAVVLLHADAAWRKLPIDLVCPDHREIDELARLKRHDFISCPCLSRGKDDALAFLAAYRDAMQAAMQAAPPEGTLAGIVWRERVAQITEDRDITWAVAAGERFEREEQAQREREAQRKREEREREERERERAQRERELRELEARERGEAAQGNALARVRAEARRLRRLVGRDSPEAAELARVRDSAKSALAAASTAPAGSITAWSTREVSSMNGVADTLIAQLRGIADPVLTLANARDRAVPRPVRAIATATHRAAKRRADRSVESIPERHRRKRDEIWSATYWAYASAHARVIEISDAQLAGHMAAYRHDVNWGTRKWRDVRQTVDFIAASSADDDDLVIYG